MSAATATDAAAPAPKGKKKLIIIIAAAVLVLGGGGVAAMMVLKKPAEHAEDGDTPAPRAAAKRAPKAVPIFVPLDPFTVNLADRDAERYAQVGITLEIKDNQLGEQIKLYMPAIRNHILMAIADRTAVDLHDRAGKAKLAEKIKRETSLALGYELEDESEAAEVEDPKPKKKKKAKPAPPELPITAVHFSNFIIQ